MRFCALLLCLWIPGCGPAPLLMEAISEKIVVIEEPFPLGYPSTNPHPNRVIATLDRGERFYLRREDFGKDYKYFKVQLLGGQKGYVIYEGAGEPKFRKVEGGK